MKKVKKLFIYLYAVIKRLILLPVAKLKYGGKQVWLVCERGTDARDNGYHMFRYLRAEHPEIEAWYVITRDSADLNKIAGLGNIAFRGSLNHWLLYIRAKIILTAFEPYYCPSGSYRFALDVKRKNRQKVVFLQHGIMGVDVPLYYQERSKFDLFICGAKPEYDFVSSHFHYTNGEVRYTGLARFDALHDFSVKKQILIMPTYRKWLEKMTEDEVSKSEYVVRWNYLLSNSVLSDIAEKYDIDIIFYPHQLMQKFVGLFTSQNPHIIIGDNRRYDVQPLLKESALLITDNSSVHFDFAYMRKPVIYYQFDEKAFEKHNARGFFDYGTMGFGEKVRDENELLSLIDGYCANEFKVKPEFEKRIEGFFPLYDACNCERIYREIRDSFLEKKG